MGGSARGAAAQEFGKGLGSTAERRQSSGTLLCVDFSHDVMSSPSVRRVLDNPRPAWRGRMHRWMIPVAVLSGIVLVVAADGGLARFSAVVFGLANLGLYAISATAHHRVWSPERLHFLFRLDQSMIMVFIAACTAPIALVAVGGSSGWVLFLGMVFGMTLGLTTIWLPFHPPRGFTNAVFLTLAWWPIIFFLPLQRGLGGGGLALLLGGAGLYTVGAFVVGSQRPNPNPHVFGYHEIWHVFVIVANVVHYVLFWLIVTGQAPINL